MHRVFHADLKIYVMIVRHSGHSMSGPHPYCVTLFEFSTKTDLITIVPSSANSGEPVQPYTGLHSAIGP